MSDIMTGLGYRENRILQGRNTREDKSEKDNIANFGDK